MNRIGSFDFIKAFAMFLVIWGHCIMHLGSWDRLDDTTFVFINSFHMPLFMIVAGYFSVNSLEISFKALISKKFTQLILPCLCWGVLLFVVGLFYSNDFSVKSVGNGLSDSIILSLWFLKALFFCYIIAFAIQHSPRWMGVGIFIFCLSLTLYKLNIMFPAFMLGIVIRKHKLLESKRLNGWLPLTIIALAFIVLTLYYDAHFLNAPNKMLGIIKSNSIAVWGSYFHRTIYSIGVGLSGAMIVIILAHKYLKDIGGFVCRVGQKTMGIYILQTLILEVVMSHTITYWGEVKIFDLLITPIISVMIMIVCYYIVLLIEKNKTLSKYLLGQ